MRAINVGSSHQVRESHEVAEPVDDGARDEMSSPHEEKGRVDPEDGGVSELKKKEFGQLGQETLGRYLFRWETATIKTTGSTLVPQKYSESAARFYCTFRTAKTIFAFLKAMQ